MSIHVLQTRSNSSLVIGVSVDQDRKKYGVARARTNHTEHGIFFAGKMTDKCTTSDQKQECERRTLRADTSPRSPTDHLNRVRTTAPQPSKFLYLLHATCYLLLRAWSTEGFSHPLSQGSSDGSRRGQRASLFQTRPFTYSFVASEGDTSQVFLPCLFCRPDTQGDLKTTSNL